ncbi:hypothetical protein GJU35_05720 [Streptomyces lincolnensis]|nr:hypothetical protein GJU35_05720 [Streptomyces lincolnensis]
METPFRARSELLVRGVPAVHPTSRRAKITPEWAGLPTGTRRRVPGLRRSEVAALADVGVECGDRHTCTAVGRGY